MHLIMISLKFYILTQSNFYPSNGIMAPRTDRVHFAPHDGALFYVYKAFSFHKPICHNFKSSSMSINEIFHSGIIPHIFKIFMTKNTFRSCSNFSQVQLKSLSSNIYNRPIAFLLQKLRVISERCK